MPSVPANLLHDLFGSESRVSIKKENQALPLMTLGIKRPGVTDEAIS
jgi:hypothetical protein